MSSITNPPAKILLTASTKISLNDRFAKLEKVKIQQTAAVHKPETVVPSRSSSGQSITPQVRLANPPASARNRQLALQMASRPNVRAALQIKKKSIRQSYNTGRAANSTLLMQQQRLQQQSKIQQQQRGFDPSRLSVNGRTFNSRGSLAHRLGNVNNNTMSNRISGVANKMRFRPSLAAVAGANMNQRIRRVGANGGARGRGGIRARGTSRLNNSAGRVAKRTSFGNRSFNRTPQSSRGGAAAGRGRGHSARNGAAKGKSDPKQKQVPKSKENLDMDLDQYMAKSKSHLDADLDSYMANAGAN